MFDRSEINYLRSRVVELERQLEAERAENRRAERHMTNMLLRRGGTYPVPPAKPEQSTAEPMIIQSDPSEKARLEAIIQQGRDLGYSQQDIMDGLRQSGFSTVTESDIAEAIRVARVN